MVSFNTTETVDRPGRELGELYHENSKLWPRASAELGRWIANLLESPFASIVMAAGRKRYSHLPRAALGMPVDTPLTSVSDLLLRRRSIQAGRAGPKFKDTSLTLSALSRLLQDAYGVTCAEASLLHGVEVPRYHRSAPSGGGLSPCEIYVIVNRCDGLSPGVYHYDAEAHELAQISPAVDEPTLASMSNYQDVVTEAAVIVIISAAFGRSYFKYADRGYRFCLLESGHIAQNLYLVCTALQLGVVAVGGFFDDSVNEILGLDGVDEAAIYLVPIGVPSDQQAMLRPE